MNRKYISDLKSSEKRKTDIGYCNFSILCLFIAVHTSRRSRGSFSFACTTSHGILSAGGQTMNDSELRRRELLKQTRRLYQDSAARRSSTLRPYLSRTLWYPGFRGRRTPFRFFLCQADAGSLSLFKLCLHRTEPSETGRYQQHTDRQRDSERNSRKWNGFHQSDQALLKLWIH